ncbi:hypothetical protein DMC30DRAFT_409418, partial [Rhodotorula diobovata]
SESFQADLFPPAPSAEPALSASDWLSGKTAPPNLLDMETRQHAAQTAPPPRQYTPAPAPAPAAQPKQAAAATPTPTPPRAASPAPAPAPAPAAAAPTPPRAASPPAPAPVDPARAADALNSVGTVSNANAGGATTNGGSPESAGAGEDELRGEVRALRAALADKDAVIRELELKLERVKAAVA